MNSFRRAFHFWKSTRSYPSKRASNRALQGVKLFWANLRGTSSVVALMEIISLEYNIDEVTKKLVFIFKVTAIMLQKDQERTLIWVNKTPLP